MKTIDEIRSERWRDAWDKKIDHMADVVANTLGKRDFFSLFNHTYKDEKIEIKCGYVSGGDWRQQIFWKYQLVYECQHETGLFTGGLPTPPSIYIPGKWVDHLTQLYQPIKEKREKKREQDLIKRYGINKFSKDEKGDNVATQH